MTDAERIVALEAALRGAVNALMSWVEATETMTGLVPIVRQGQAVIDRARTLLGAEPTPQARRRPLWLYAEERGK